MATRRRLQTIFDIYHNPTGSPENWKYFEISLMQVCLYYNYKWNFNCNTDMSNSSRRRHRSSHRSHAGQKLISWWWPSNGKWFWFWNVQENKSRIQSTNTSTILKAYMKFHIIRRLTILILQPASICHLPYELTNKHRYKTQPCYYVSYAMSCSPTNASLSYLSIYWRADPVSVASAGAGCTEDRTRLAACDPSLEDGRCAPSLGTG